jgi:ribosomal protein S27E
MTTFRPASIRNVVLIVIAVLLIAAAVAHFALRGGGEDAAPDDQFVDFRCTACNHTFRMSYSEFEKAWNERKFTRQPDGRTLYYECPACGEHKAVRVAGSGAATPGPD